MCETLPVCRACECESESTFRHATTDAILCEDCAILCEECDGAFTELESVCGREICEECRNEIYTRCVDCREWYDPDTGGGCDQNGGGVCESCAENYFYCDGCHETFHNDDYGGDCLCENCYRENSTILPYDADPPSYKYGKGPHYLGIELEVECRRDREDSAQECLDIFDGFAICKSDGSLDDGFEIVTAPADLTTQKQYWGKFFDNRPSGLRSHDTATCGLHVHCSRAPLSELTIGKILLFVNCQQNTDFIQKLARRSSTYAKIKHDKKPSDRSRDRYEAVNLTNDHTIEFRIFRGTLKRETFFACLEFCAALIEFCKPSNHSLSDCLGHEKFCAFVRKERKQFPFLVQWLQSKGY